MRDSQIISVLAVNSSYTVVRNPFLFSYCIKNSQFQMIGGLHLTDVQIIGV